MYSKWEQPHPWGYISSSKNGWLCKICKEYPETCDEFSKSKACAHDDHTGKMFLIHLHGESHKKTIYRKHVFHSMLRKGIIKAQITTWAKNSEIHKREQNRRVIKTIYFMWRKKCCENNFHDLMEPSKNLGDEELIKHFQTMDNNATYLFTSQNVQLMNYRYIFE